MGLLAEGESLYSASNLNLLHHVTAAIRAHYLYQRNVHYIIHEGEVIIVMKIPVVPCQVVAGLKVCTRQLKQKKVWKFSGKPNPCNHNIPELFPSL